MKNNKPALKTLSFSIMTLLCSSWAIADDSAVISAGFPDVSYEFKDGKLQEKFGDIDSVTYSKADLPKSCVAIDTATQGVEEKHKKQPTADIVGNWKMDDDNSATSIDGDDSYVMPSYFVSIKSNGEITAYNFDDKASTCDLVMSDELDGNKLSYNEPVSNVDLTKVKVTKIDKQLAVINVLKETYTDSDSSKSVDYAQAYLYDAVSSLPQKCDITAKRPSQEKSNNNPNAALVGNWLDKTQEFLGDDMLSQQYFVLTSDGFMFTANYEKYEQNEDCFVEYIGEVVGDTYTK